MAAQNYQLLSNLSQLLTHRHYQFQSLYDADEPSAKPGKRYSGASCMSMMNNPNMIQEDPIMQNPEMDMNFNNEPADQLSFSITQGLQALKDQLNIDINDIIKNGHLLENENEPFFNTFDINNPEISNLLRTPPTMGTQLHTFRHEHDLRNQLPENISSQSSSSDGVVPTDKNFNRVFEKLDDSEAQQNEKVASKPKEIDEISK